MNKDWSLTELENTIFEREDKVRKNIYASDAEKCLRGVYFSLMGEEPTNPDEPQGLRRMEVGNMIEANQVKKLRKLGLVLVANDLRIFDEEHKVSGRPDAVIISPDHCTTEAKKLIKRKRKIFELLEKLDGQYWTAIGKYNSGEMEEELFVKGEMKIHAAKRKLYAEDRAINQELLKPDPRNSLMMIEFKSIGERGFQFRLKDGKPMDGHADQAMFYLWKMRESYPYLVGRVAYVETTYQKVLEFDVEVDDIRLGILKSKWKAINEAVDAKVPPPAAPSIVLNPFTKRWQVNFQADYCKYHIKCTGDANWRDKAFKEAQEKNKK